jgi:NTP pyrophosphatase (non-canonical NTP hydrolase)
LAVVDGHVPRRHQEEAPAHHRAVLFEEVDELWEEVRAKQGERDLDAMRAECIQVAAMAVRFAMDICTPEKVQK